MRTRLLFIAGTGLLAVGCFLVNRAVIEEFVKRGII